MGIAGGAFAAAAVLGTAVWATSGSGDDARPTRFTSMPEACSLVPGEILERIVPRSEPPVPSTAQNSTTARYAACEWSEPPGIARPGTTAAHRLDISVRLHLDGDAAAKSEYDAAWRGARAMAGTATGAPGDLHGEAPSVVRIGEQAFTQHLTLNGTLGRSGTVKTTARLRNAVITVRYTGATAEPGTADPKTREKPPLDEATARNGAEQVARAVTEALTRCGTCLERQPGE